MGTEAIITQQYFSYLHLILNNGYDLYI